ncbi:unnamed protein product [Pleuronectes platessa]|uniref:Uncharacterized protein n=1 Tax=Pleuronectes platessa TaxID=8262 RepID=A0A9N7UV96_PLEPL|nr:unnamed protein product [Pleuronectes platessa]
MQLNCFPQEKKKKEVSLQFAQTESDTGSATEWITEQKLCRSKENTDKDWPVDILLKQPGGPVGEDANVRVSGKRKQLGKTTIFKSFRCHHSPECTGHFPVVVFASDNLDNLLLCS